MCLCVWRGITTDLVSGLKFRFLLKISHKIYTIMEISTKLPPKTGPFIGPKCLCDELEEEVEYWKRYLPYYSQQITNLKQEKIKLMRGLVEEMNKRQKLENEKRRLKIENDALKKQLNLVNTAQKNRAKAIAD